MTETLPSPAVAAQPAVVVPLVQTVADQPVAPLLHFEGEASRREARALVREGLLRPLLHGVHLPADVPVDATVRALAVEQVLPRRLRRLAAVACYDTAVWVHAGGPAPDRVHVAVPPPGTRSPVATVIVHGLSLAPDEIDPAGGGGVAVTTSARTAADQLRRLSAAEAWGVLDLLERASRLDCRAVAQRLEAQSGQRGVRRARRTLAAWTSLRRATAVPGQSPLMPVTR